MDLLLDFREQILASLPQPLGATIKDPNPSKFSSSVRRKRTHSHGHYSMGDTPRSQVGDFVGEPWESGRSRGGAVSGGAVQDSGFNSETKEQSSRLWNCTSNNTRLFTSDIPPTPLEDELWKLLDDIHKKGEELKEETNRSKTNATYQRSFRPGRVRKYEKKPKITDSSRSEKLRAILEDGAKKSEYSSLPLNNVTDVNLQDLCSQVKSLQLQRDVWMERVSILEAEASTTRAHIQQLQFQVQQVLKEKKLLQQAAGFKTSTPKHNSTTSSTSDYDVISLTSDKKQHSNTVEMSVDSLNLDPAPPPPTTTTSHTGKYHFYQTTVHF